MADAGGILPWGAIIGAVTAGNERQEASNAAQRQRLEAMSGPSQVGGGLQPGASLNRFASQNSGQMSPDTAMQLASLFKRKPKVDQGSMQLQGSTQAQGPMSAVGDDGAYGENSNMSSMNDPNAWTNYLKG